MKKDLFWSASLIVAGLSAFVLAASRLASIRLPDALVRTLGILCLIALPVLAFTSVRKFQTGKKEKNERTLR